jgi:AcrR family transcriptional regulator
MTAATTGAGPGERVQRDGRSARAERTRDAVVDALLALMEEGELRPTAPRIAERAGVSLRSVFQHFDDMEALFSAAADRQIARMLGLARPVRRDGPLDERIAEFTAQRAELMEAISPVRRSAVLSEPFSAEVAKRLRWVRHRGQVEIERLFAPELAHQPAAKRRELTAALTVASSWSAWEALRSHQELSPTQARRVMARIITALLKED